MINKNRVKLMAAASLLLPSLILAQSNISSTATSNALYSFIDNKETSPDTSIDRTSCKDVSTLSIILGAVALQCKFTSQRAWPGTAAGYIQTGGVWTHEIYIAAPRKVLGTPSDDYVFYVDGGSNESSGKLENDPILTGMVYAAVEQKIKNGDAEFSGLNESHLRNLKNQLNGDTALIAELVATLSGRPVVLERQDPNQSLKIKSIVNESYYPRREDDLLAESMMYPLSADYHGNMNYLVQYPATAAIIHGMEALKNTNLSSLSKYKFPPIKQFILSGASKRAWFSYLAAAYDADHNGMIRALIPIVMPFDWQEVLQTIKDKYGVFTCGDSGESTAFTCPIYQDFEVDSAYKTGPRNLATKIVSGDPDMESIMDTLDFGNYLRAQGTSVNFKNYPIFAISASNDNYFTPDSQNIFMSDLWSHDSRASFITIPNLGHGGVDPSSIKAILPYAMQMFSFMNYINRYSTFWASFNKNGDGLDISSEIAPESAFYTCAWAQKRSDLIDIKKGIYGKENALNLATFSPENKNGNGDGVHSVNSYASIVRQVTDCGGNKPTQGFKAFSIILKYNANDLPGTKVSEAMRTSPIYIESL